MSFTFEKGMSSKIVDSGFDIEEQHSNRRRPNRGAHIYSNTRPHGPENDLWRAVLVLGLKEHVRGKDTSWIDSPGYREVCANLNLDPSAVRRAVEGRRIVFDNRADSKRRA